MSTRRTERYDSVENWEAENPVLAAGEWGIAEFIIDGKRVARAKIGNGDDKWKDLPYTPSTPADETVGAGLLNGYNIWTGVNDFNGEITYKGESLANAIETITTKSIAEMDKSAFTYNDTEIKEEIAEINTKIISINDDLTKSWKYRVFGENNERKAYEMGNHDVLAGYGTGELEGQSFNLAMVSKWNVADFGSSQLPLNLNCKDGKATINDTEAILTTTDKTEIEAKIQSLVDEEKAHVEIVSSKSESNSKVLLVNPGSYTGTDLDLTNVTHIIGLGDVTIYKLNIDHFMVVQNVGISELNILNDTLAVIKDCSINKVIIDTENACTFERCTINDTITCNKTANDTEKDLYFNDCDFGPAAYFIKGPETNGVAIIYKNCGDTIRDVITKSQGVTLISHDPQYRLNNGVLEVSYNGGDWGAWNPV